MFRRRGRDGKAGGESPSLELADINQFTTKQITALLGRFDQLRGELPALPVELAVSMPEIAAYPIAASLLIAYGTVYRKPPSDARRASDDPSWGRASAARVASRPRHDAASGGRPGLANPRAAAHSRSASPDARRPAERTTRTVVVPVGPLGVRVAAGANDVGAVLERFAQDTVAVRLLKQAGVVERSTFVAIAGRNVESAHIDDIKDLLAQRDEPVALVFAAPAPPAPALVAAEPAALLRDGSPEDGRAGSPPHGAALGGGGGGDPSALPAFPVPAPDGLTFSEFVVFLNVLHPAQHAHVKVAFVLFLFGDGECLDRVGAWELQRCLHGPCVGEDELWQFADSLLASADPAPGRRGLTFSELAELMTAEDLRYSLSLPM